MKHINQRNIKIINELMSFCINKCGASNLHIDLNTEDYKTIINIKAKIKNINPLLIKAAQKLLNTPRYHEIEEYYWNLSGNDDTDSELTLVGMMTDEAHIYYHEGEYLEIKVTRINEKAN